MLLAIALGSIARWTALRTNGLLNGGRELFSNMTLVRGAGIFSTLTFESPCSAATDTAGITEAISASPVRT